MTVFAPKSATQTWAKRLFQCLFIGLIFMLAGCKTTPEPAPEPIEPIAEIPAVPQNPAIVEAAKRLIQVQAAGAEWLVIESTLSASPIALSKILQQAKQKQDAGDIREATRLAEKVTRFALLGLDQANNQKGALPYYTE